MVQLVDDPLEGLLGKSREEGGWAGRLEEWSCTPVELSDELPSPVEVDHAHEEVEDPVDRLVLDSLLVVYWPRVVDG